MDAPPHILCRPAALPPSPPSPAGIRRCPPKTHNSTEDKEGRAGEGEHPREEEADKSRGSKKEKAGEEPPPPPASPRAVLLRATVSDLVGEGDAEDDSVKLHPGHTLVVAVSVSKNMALAFFFPLPPGGIIDLSAPSLPLNILLTIFHALITNPLPSEPVRPDRTLHALRPYTLSWCRYHFVRTYIQHDCAHGTTRTLQCIFSQYSSPRVAPFLPPYIPVHASLPPIPLRASLLFLSSSSLGTCHLSPRNPTFLRGFSAE